MLPPALEEFLESTVGPVRVQALAGGDINKAARLETKNGPLFLKFHNRAPPGMFQAEARGLGALSAATPGLFPGVVAQHEAGLVLEWLDLSGQSAGAASGEALAKLHRIRTGGWGGQPGNFLGTLAQHQPPCGSWAELYGEHRLLPLAEGCPRRLRHALESLLPRLAELLDDRDEPSHVHGDLWGGNAGMRTDGQPVFFDPAHATAHRELDLAMSLLFGGFQPAFYRAYEESHPLQPGWKDRVALHQLYFILAHYHLFGSPYDQQALSLAKAYL